MHSDNFYYDKRKKCHRISDEFTAWYINTRPEKYLGYIRATAEITCYWDEEKWTLDISFESDSDYLAPPQRSELIKTVLSSIREKYSLYIVYRAKFKTRAMLISAHSLVYANHRYHIRAFDDEKGRFVYLVLTRFIEANKAEEEWVSPLNDMQWHHKLSLRFAINPKLPTEVQQALQADYSLGETMIRTIKVRQAMLGYICREMERIDWRYGMRLWLDRDKCCVRHR